MLVGRQHEIRILQEAATCNLPQLIAVYGRRRVGKTYLIREVFKNSFTFQHAGAYNKSRKTQLYLFYQALLDAGLPKEDPAPKNWFEAFSLLKTVIRNSTQKKKVIFIDELSWMDTPKSDMIPALEHFWNAWASARNDVVLILCSSATSWIINKIIHNKGGLYNRLTGRIYLPPFTLAQCREFSQSRNLALSDTQLLELYMVLGGIPFYWDQLQKGYSVPQNVDYLFFQQNAPLRDEYTYLFASIFRNPAPYERIILALTKRRLGLTRNELLASTGMSGSGTVSRYLQELEACGFIREYTCFGKKTKDALYQLTDPFVLFYHHFVSKKPKDPHFWTSLINTPALNTWCGLAFEQICLLHVDQIRKALGISGVLTNASSFLCKANPEEGIIGSQIDLVLQRADHVINLLEMKYTQGPYTLTKKGNEELKIKLSDFRLATGTQDALHITMVTPPKKSSPRSSLKTYSNKSPLWDTW